MSAILIVGAVVVLACLLWLVHVSNRQYARRRRLTGSAGYVIAAIVAVPLGVALAVMLVIGASR